MKFGIRTRLSCSYLVAFMLIAAVGGVGIWSDRLSTRQSMRLIETNLPLMMLMNRLRGEIFEKEMDLRGFLLHRSAEAVEKLREVDGRIKATEDQMRSLIRDEASRGCLDRIQKANADYAALAEKVFVLMDEGNMYQAMDLADEQCPKSLSQLDTLCAEWSSHLETDNAKQISYVLQRGKVAIAVVATGVVIAGLMMVAMSSIVSRTIAAPVVRLHAVADAVAAGDLTARLPEIATGDEIAGLNRAIQRMVADLTDLLHGVRQEAELVAGASAKLAESSVARMSTCRPMPAMFPSPRRAPRPPPSRRPRPPPRSRTLRLATPAWPRHRAETSAERRRRTPDAPMRRRRAPVRLTPRLEHPQRPGRRR